MWQIIQMINLLTFAINLYNEVIKRSYFTFPLTRMYLFSGNTEAGGRRNNLHWSHSSTVQQSGNMVGGEGGGRLHQLGAIVAFILLLQLQSKCTYTGTIHSTVHNSVKHTIFKVNIECVRIGTLVRQLHSKLLKNAYAFCTARPSSCYEFKFRLSSCSKDFNEPSTETTWKLSFFRLIGCFL